MGNLEHDTDAGLADFMAGWCKALEESVPWIPVTGAVVGLTNYGEKPVPSTRLAEVLGESVSEAEALAGRWGPPGTRVEDGFISVNPCRWTSRTSTPMFECGRPSTPRSRRLKDGWPLIAAAVSSPSGRRGT
jgi:hypothetical protein